MISENGGRESLVEVRISVSQNDDFDWYLVRGGW